VASRRVYDAIRQPGAPQNTRMTLVLAKGEGGWKIVQGCRIEVDAEAARFDPIRGQKARLDRQPIASVGDLFDAIALEEQRRPQIGMLDARVRLRSHDGLGLVGDAQDPLRGSCRDAFAPSPIASASSARAAAERCRLLQQRS